MNETELAYTSAVDLAAMIRKRDVSPVEVAELFLTRIKASQPALNAFLAIAGERAVAEARAAEALVMRGGADLPPLLGVPYTVKDLIDTEGVRTTYASLALADNIPAADGVTVARMKQSGAVMLAKTTTPEFGHKPMNEAPIFGKTHNPWDLQRTCGGSSGGSGAAVAAGLGPLSIGTDAGGSTRIPAACCGIVGIKATLGRVPHDIAPDAFGNFANQGPMARTVADAALMLQVLSGSDPRDPHSHGLPDGNYVAAARGEGDLKGLRVAWRPRMGNRLVDPEILAACEDMLSVLRDLGAVVEELDEPLENAEPHWLVITQSLWVARFEHLLDKWGDKLTPTLARGIKEGADYTAVELQRAVVWRTQLFRRVQQWFGQHDLLVTPTLARTALDIDHDFYAPVRIAGEEAGSIRQNWYPYTHPFNMTGHPAITIPCGWMSDGLPAAFQIVGPLMGEERMLRVAAMLEAARPWAHKRPSVPGLNV
ncbi:MAG: amidase [Rhodospirillaceae bacterium]|nr:amidase [Rhodospirillaceae bacterium]